MNQTAAICKTALGPIEVGIHGAGIPVVVLHGSPGGVDAARAMSRFLPERHFQTICVSRPGYLGTPLDPAEASIDHEVDLLIAALDTLEVKRALVFAWSGGGPAGYRLAVRHPDRISAMVAIAALSARWVAPAPTASESFMLGTPIGRWLIACMARYAPERIVYAALENTGSLHPEEVRKLTRQVMANPQQRRLILDITTTVGIGGRRRKGWQNDVANFARIDSLELARVRCPVLLVHGDGDINVVPEYSRSAHAQLSDSELVIMEAGTHLAFYAHPEALHVQDQVRTWLANHV